MFTNLALGFDAEDPDTAPRSNERRLERTVRDIAATRTPLSLPQTWTITEKITWAEWHRERLDDETKRARETHRAALGATIEYRARAHQKRRVTDVLADLSGAGLAWRDIARVIGVSVPAVRRWRQGESPTAENRDAIARLAALMEALTGLGVEDAATWLELPIDPAAPVNGLDLAAERCFEDLCELARGHVTGAELLDARMPDWRSHYRREYEVFRAEDGELGLRPVSRDESGDASHS